MIPLMRLLALLPLLAALAAAGHLDRVVGAHHGIARAHAHAVDSVEYRMARRNAGRTLAVRKANEGQCRERGAQWHPSALVLAVSNATSTLPSASSAVSTAVATTTSTVSVVPTTTEAATSAYVAPASVSPSPSPAPQPTQAPSPPPASSGGNTGMTPNGIKAGMSAGDSYDFIKDHIGWWYDWTPNPSGHWGSPVAVPMIWGAGSADHTDWARLEEFKGMSHTPPYIIGFEEPDCAAGSGSAGFDVDTGAALWNSLIAPKGAAGSLLLSPSMCKQAAESGWLQPFRAKISRDWDITNVHINKVDAAGIRMVIDHYWNTYGKPIWVTEFACVNDVDGFTPCTDQAQINQYIHTAVQIFESDSRVAAYAYSNGYGLGDVWPAMKNGQLSESGKAYLAAISQYH